MRLCDRPHRCLYCGAGEGSRSRDALLTVACASCLRLRSDRTLAEFAALARTSTDPRPAAFRARSKLAGELWWQTMRPPEAPAARRRRQARLSAKACAEVDGLAAALETVGEPRDRWPTSIAEITGYSLENVRAHLLLRRARA